LAQAVALCLVPLLAPLSVLTATAPTAIYSLSLHDALPISGRRVRREQLRRARRPLRRRVGARGVHKGVESREIAAQRNGPVPGTEVGPLARIGPPVPRHLRGLLRASRAGHVRGEKRVDQRRLAGGHVTDDGDPQRLGTLRRSVQQDWLVAEFTPSLKAQAHVGESRGGRTLGGGHASVLTRSTRNRWLPDR